MSNPTPILNNINAFDATKGTTISFNIIGGTDIVRSNIAYIYDLSTNDLICTHLYISTESIHELPPNTDPSIVYADGKSSADFVNNKNYYLQIQTFTNTAGTAGGSGMSVAKTFWCLFNPALSVNAIPAAISTTSYNVGATYTTNITDVTIPVTNIIQQYKFDLYTATGTLVQTSGNIIGSGEQEGTSTTYNITYNFSGLVVNNSYYVIVTTTSTEGMTVSAQSNTFTVSIDTPTVGGAIVNNNACDGYISVTSNLSDEYGGNVSGEMASFETDSVNNVSSLKVNMEPIQDLHGYDKPWVGGAGKQLIPITESAEYIKYGVTISVGNDGVVTFEGTSTSAFSQTFVEFELPAGSYVFSGFGSTAQSTGGNTYIYVRDIDNSRTLGEMTIGNTERRDTFTLTTQTRVRYYMVCSGLGLTLSGQAKVLLADASVTDTSYAPYENLCPISGHTECVTEVCGVNLFDKTAVEVGYVNDNTGEVNPLTTYRCTDYIAVEPNATYYVKTEQNNGGWGAWYDANKNYISRAVGYFNITLTAPSNARYMRLTCLTSTSGNIDTFAINYPSTDHEYHAYTGQTISQEFDVSLTPTSTDTDPYLFKAVGDIYGDRLEDKIVGGTVAWNQLCKVGYPVTQTVNGITFTNNQDGSITANGTATADAYESTSFFLVDGRQLGRVYYIGGCPNGGSASTYWFGGRYLMNADIQHDFGNGRIAKDLNGAQYSSTFTICVNSGTTVSNLVFKPQVIDLTAMFGSTIADYIYSLEQANAGAGVAWFRQYFPKDYYPYDHGTLRSVEGVSAHETVGFNQWDEEWEVGALIADGSVDATLTNRRTTSFISVIPNATYYYQRPELASGGRYAWYTADKQVIAYDVNGYFVRQFTAPSNARYLRLTFAGPYGTTYNHDICINISDPSRNGEYEPYQKHTYPLDSSLTLRGVPKLDAGGNLYYDGDVYASDGTVTRRYGIVDLGTLSWSDYNAGIGETPHTIFATTGIGNLIKHDRESEITMMCSKYQGVGNVTSNSAAWARGDKTCCALVNNDGRVYVRDDTFDGYTRAQVKSALSGVYLVYELATPTTETAEPFTNPQVVDNRGTEAYVTTGIVPVGHDTTYLTRDIFGGTLDLVTGVLTVDRAMVDLGTLNWGKGSSSWYTSSLSTLIKRPASNNDAPQLIMSTGPYKPVSSNWDTGVAGSYEVIINRNNGLLSWRYPMDAYTDATAFKTAMSGQTLCYELATPQTYQLTPHQIQTLVGQNNIWSDAGDVEVTFNLPISNLLVKRQDASDVSGNWLTLYSQPITQASDMDFTFIDFLNQHGKTYRYALVPLLTQQQGGIDVEIEGGYTVSDDVLSVFDGVFIANNNGSQKLKAATEYGDLETNQDVGVLTTIGGKYPFVVSNSNLNYHSGSISALIVPSDFYTDGDLDRLSIVERREAIEKFLTDKTAKILKDWNGNIWLITFVENVEVSFVDDYGMGLGTLSAKWVEIGDVNDQTDLKQTGLI